MPTAVIGSTSLHHPPGRVIAALLAEGGLVADPAVTPLGAWPGYATNEPDKPDLCVTVYGTAGSGDGRTQPDGEVQEHKGIQVRVRSRDAPTGYAKACAIRRWLSETVYANRVVITEVVDDNPLQQPRTVTTTYAVACLSRFGDVVEITKDVPKTKRSVHTFNCLAAIRLIPNS